MRVIPLLVPAIFLFVLVFAACKKVKPFDAFAEGAGKALSLIATLFPYLCAVFVLTELFSRSGLSDRVIGFLSPALSLFGIPEEIAGLVLLKPFSGSGSLALLTEIYKTCGADSYAARCASAVFGSSETIFYLSAVYFSGVKNQKRSPRPIVISLAATFVSTVSACFLCRFL